MSGVQVYLVRHAEPEGTDEQWRFLGWSDPPLSTAGIEQARALAEHLNGVHFDAVYSSDLCRATMTAEILVRTRSQARKGAPALTRPGTRPPTRRRVQAPNIKVRPELREIDAGLWEGLTRQEAQERYPEEHARREADLFGRPFPRGESLLGLRERVLPAFRRIVQEGGERLLVVAHKGPIRLLLCEYLGLPLEEVFSFPVAYCEVKVLEVPAEVRADMPEDGPADMPAGV